MVALLLVEESVRVRIPIAAQTVWKKRRAFGCVVKEEIVKTPNSRI